MYSSLSFDVSLRKRSLSYPFVHGEDGVDTGDFGREGLVINRGVCLAQGRREPRPGRNIPNKSHDQIPVDYFIHKIKISVASRIHDFVHVHRAYYIGAVLLPTQCCTVTQGMILPNSHISRAPLLCRSASTI